VSHLAVFPVQNAHIFEDKIIASFNQLTLNSPGLPNQPVIEYVRYTLTNDFKLTLSHQKLDARNYALLGKSETITCSKETGGVKVFG
jgi:hypothetical protein